MILCDIGNSFFHFYYRGRIWKEPISKLSHVSEEMDIYYISVNKKGEKKLLGMSQRTYDIAPFIQFDTIYKGLGVDRAAACKAVDDGVVIDAGSAVTVDVMQNGIHLGGYIMPGIGALKNALKQISPVLDEDINMAVDLGAFPQNTKDALSYGVLKPILMMIRNSSKSKPTYFTGGDGKFLSRYFENSIYDASLVFKGMERTIKERQKGAI